MFRFASWKPIGAFVVVVAAVAAVTALTSARPTGAQGETNQMAVDADASTTTVDTVRAVSGTSPFTISVNMTQANTPYIGYQVELTWPDAGLNFVSSTQLSPGSMALCAAPNVRPGTNDTYQSACSRTTWYV